PEPRLNLRYTALTSPWISLWNLGIIRMLKFGKKPATYTPRSMGTALVLARHLDPLGSPPPASNNYVEAVEKATGGDWGMMGNDLVGDCVIADDAHYHMLRTANTGTIEIPTTQQVLDQYSAVTGYNPNNPATD